MIRCNLSTLMGREKMKVIDVARALNIHRNTVTLLYSEEAKRIDLETLNGLCRLFKCTPNDLFEYVPDKTDSE